MKKSVATFIALTAFSAVTVFAANDPAKETPKEAPKDKPKQELNDEPHTYKKCLRICIEEIGERDKCERICDTTPKK